MDDKSNVQQFFNTSFMFVCFTSLSKIWAVEKRSHTSLRVAWFAKARAAPSRADSRTYYANECWRNFEQRFFYQIKHWFPQTIDSYYRHHHRQKNIHPALTFYSDARWKTNVHFNVPVLLGSYFNIPLDCYQKHLFLSLCLILKFISCLYRLCRSRQSLDMKRNLQSEQELKLVAW